MAEDFLSYARKAAQKAGLDPELFIRQIQQESGFDPNAVSSAGARGIAQIMPNFHPGVNTADPYASLDYAANLDAANLKKFGSVRDMLVAYNAGPGDAGKPDEQLPAETRDYLGKILGGTAAAVPSPAAATPSPSPIPQSTMTASSPFAGQLLRGGVNPLAVALLGGSGRAQQATASAPPAPAASKSAPPASGGLVPNQFGDANLSADEAYAACGPAAAAAFARANGRNPTLREALDLAKQTGWTAQGGMNGIANQKALLDKMGIPATMTTSADWPTIQAAAQSQRPVSISTPKHYFVADGYDPQTKRYHVGNSGLALKAGAEWLSQQEIERLGGGVNGALFLH